MDEATLQKILHFLTMDFIPLMEGLVTLLIGIAAFAKPQAMSKKFGIAASGAALPYVVSTGIRDVFIGVLLLFLLRQQMWTTLGLTQVPLAIVALSDFAVVREHGDAKTAWLHLSAAIAALMYGTWVLFFSGAVF